MHSYIKQSSANTVNLPDCTVPSSMQSVLHILEVAFGGSANVAGDGRMLASAVDLRGDVHARVAIKEGSSLELEANVLDRHHWEILGPAVRTLSGTLLKS